MMYVYRTCPLCADEHCMSIDVEQEQIDAWDNGMLIQEAMPHLTPEEREHIKTGICEKCWPSDEDEVVSDPLDVNDLFDKFINGSD